MSGPLITPTQLGTYLGDESINVDRAAMIIADAQDACESVVNPIPANKVYVLRRVALKAYTAGGNQGRGYQLQKADADQVVAVAYSGVQLSAADRADLLGDEEVAAPFESFTIRTTPQPPLVGHPSFGPYGGYGAYDRFGDCW